MTAAAATPIQMRCAQVRRLQSWLSWPIPRSNLHLHDFFVGRYDLVAHLEEQIEGQLGFLGLDGYLMEFLALARQKALDAGLCVPSEALDLGDGIVEHQPEFGSHGAGRRGRGRRGNRRNRDVDRENRAHDHLRMSIERLIMSFTAVIAATLPW